MKSIVVIASYWGGKRHADVNGIVCLERQLESLQTLKHNVDVVVVATQREASGPYKDIIDQFPNVIYRDNKGGSYLSWLYAWETFGDQYDWYYLLEDDYVFALDNFDIKMQGMFDKDTGYLCSYYSKSPIYHLTIANHASISNGLVHRRAFEKSDFSQCYDLDIYDHRLQVNWSFALDSTEFKVKDVHERYDTPFFTGESIWRFNDNPILIKPIQMFDDKYPVVKYK